jgi:hypothetical protein
VWLIQLAPLADPAHAPITIAAVLGVQQEPDRPLMPTLLDWPRPKQLLLSLDNCEHLIEACATFADGALHAGRELRILATSREVLAIARETSYRVPSLESPTLSQANAIPHAQLTQFPAVRLFYYNDHVLEPDAEDPAAKRVFASGFSFRPSRGSEHTGLPPVLQSKRPSRMDGLCADAPQPHQSIQPE